MRADPLPSLRPEAFFKVPADWLCQRQEKSAVVPVFRDARAVRSGTALPSGDTIAGNSCPVPETSLDRTAALPDQPRSGLRRSLVTPAGLGGAWRDQIRADQSAIEQTCARLRYRERNLARQRGSPRGVVGAYAGQPRDEHRR